MWNSKKIKTSDVTSRTAGKTKLLLCVIRGDTATSNSVQEIN